ncbi:MAG TPA: hypothetical protein VFO10_29260 [Oligoflexus sp.]|uniref:hypothetical protein n=1 Tax=Oligoflexus sp. TaxID=1971216 RepID=UPI002D800136|nr:hypothetical protein [Oligoflexus sp.]HET9241391.1 hypothetical protein [Oligoflexus sp.]
MSIKSVIAVLALTSVSTQAFAGDEEYMEVAAPNECCQTPLPGSLGMLTGWVGAAGAAASGGSATLKGAALKAAAKKAAEQKSKANEKKDETQQQANEFQEVTQGNPGVLQTLIHELGLTWRQAMDTGVRYQAKEKDSNGNEVTIEECKPGGPLASNGIKCTQQKIELFTDPTDGVERWVFTLSVVEARYNPIHYEAEPSGYYAEVVDKQTLSLIFDTMEDLTWQLLQVAAAR